MELLRDKIDGNKGLQNTEGELQITTYPHIIQIDSRDFTGQRSLEESIRQFELLGGRGEESAYITGMSPKGSYPLIIYTNTKRLRDGDFIQIEGINNNYQINNYWKISSVLPNSFQINIQNLFNYTSGGLWIKLPDNGYPQQGLNYIIGNSMVINLQRKIKIIRSITLNVSSIPRDIIPFEEYFKDYQISTTLNNQQTFIPQTEQSMKNLFIGLFSTNISFFRSYTGIYQIPNISTRPPLTLWNPNTIYQPVPYLFQTVPTYKSGTKLYLGKIIYVVLSGYGVYDLLDWSGMTREITENIRKLVIKKLVRQQIINGFNQNQIIDLLETTSSNIYPYGYGDFQRFIPGPGLGQNYQPGTSDGQLCNVSILDSPVPFPNFLGNVWGPYSSPGDRFQKIGTRDTLQDLFLNGDLDNLHGMSVINDDLIPSQFMTDPSGNYGLNPSLFQPVTLGNIRFSTNPNIINAMRINPNGFGALTVSALGSGATSQYGYGNSGGIAPGINGNWVANTVLGGPFSFTDPQSVGFTNSNIPSNLSSANLPTTSISYYSNQTGNFISNITNYVNYLITNLPDTNLVIIPTQFPRDERVQCTNPDVSPSILNIPIRLTPGTTDGTLGYVEGLYALLSQSSDFEYWGKRFLTPLASLEKITLNFYTYSGLPIDLEKMLTNQNQNQIQNQAQNQIQNQNQNQVQSPLINSRKNISLIFRAECYQYVNPGLNNIFDVIQTDEA